MLAFKFEQAEAEAEAEAEMDGASCLLSALSSPETRLAEFRGLASHIG